MEDPVNLTGGKFNELNLNKNKHAWSSNMFVKM
jgi:hypothetical protein